MTAGVGSALVPAGLAVAESLGEPLVVLKGSPRYYPRFGFRDCRTLGITIQLVGRLAGRHLRGSPGAWQ